MSFQHKLQTRTSYTMIHQIFLVFAALLVVFLPFSSVHGYGEKYTTPQKATVDCSKAPTPISWHVHVTYMLTNDEQIKDVQEFREEAMKYWAPLLGDDPICRGTTFDPSGRYGKRSTPQVRRL